eukprot:1400923-Amphidinium_carterae.6
MKRSTVRFARKSPTALAMSQPAILETPWSMKLSLSTLQKKPIGCHWRSCKVTVIHLAGKTHKYRLPSLASLTIRILFTGNLTPITGKSD